jgi:hypothetical protein
VGDFVFDYLMGAFFESLVVGVPAYDVGRPT